MLCISENPTNFYSISRSDLMAEDWEIGVGGEIEKMDDSQKRFSLLELNVLDDME